MADDWIKMRTDLYRDPKVIMIAERLMDPGGDLARHVSYVNKSDMSVTLRMSRNVTVGSLVSVWGVTRQRGKRHDDDLLVSGATLKTIDEICDTPGFGAAMESVGWVAENNQGIVFPGFFKEHNVDPNGKKAKTAAERAAKYRQKKRNESNENVTLRAVTESHKNHALEKSREEYITTPPKGVPPKKVEIEKPDGLNDEAWSEYVDYRKKSKLRKLQPKSVEKQMLWLVDQGDETQQAAVVDQTIRNSYQGLFELKANGNGTGNPGVHRETATERAAWQADHDRKSIARRVG